MRRLIAIVPVLLVIAAPTGAAAATEDFATSDSASAVPELAVKVVKCQVGGEAAERSASFSGAMPAAPGASVLSMSFELEQRLGDAWKSVSPPSFEEYERSAKGAAGFVYVKRVLRLAPGTAYRVTVRFKWVGADGSVRKRATRVSAPCRQPDLRPDFLVTGITPTEVPGDPDRISYLVDIRNDGLGDALATLRVSLAVNGTPLPGANIAGLLADDSATVVFAGPACPPGGTLTATVDPADRIDESHERDNRLVVPCG